MKHNTLRLMGASMPLLLEQCVGVGGWPEFNPALGLFVGSVVVSKRWSVCLSRL